MPTIVRTGTAARLRTGWRRSSGCRKHNRRMPMKRGALVLAVLFSGFAGAQSFPAKTVRFVSGVTPGSASDTMARILAEKLQGKWGQPVIVENRLGAGGLVGAKYVADSQPDG